jgi:hypothetical protein
MEIIQEPEVVDPEPVSPIITDCGTVIIPELVNFNDYWITMSSKWRDERMKEWNVVKTDKFNPQWGHGEFTCIHTLNDKEGAWWQAKFGKETLITKVDILNRGDCCGSRLNGVKVFIGENLCG